MQTDGQKRRFQVVLIKPSHYDEAGYVIQWHRSTMPSNSLASVYALAVEAAANQVLGPDVEIEITAIDETNTRVRPDRLIADFKANDNFGMVGLVGVQSNEFPRTLDIIRPLREANIQVVIGGFHVSGCISMLSEPQADVQQAMDLGAILFAGEAEDDKLGPLLQDIAAGRARPIYDNLAELPGIGNIKATPFLPGDFVKRTVGNVTSFDAGRGCPFQCSFCTIINVQGRKSRYRSPDSVEHILRQNWEQGIDRFFITDDNFARNKDWEVILDRIIKLREEDDMDVRFLIQVDTQCHKISGFMEKCKRAGVTRIFIGLENINPDNLLIANKHQNKLTDYRTMLLGWKSVGIMTFAGYILGFPGDTPASMRRDIEIIKRELPVDALEFFVLTPLPGSADHRDLTRAEAWMDPDLNKYALENVVSEHANMTRGEWQQAYRDSWDIFYTPEHIETIMRRAEASGIDISRLMVALIWFSSAVAIEGLHPIQAGLFRKKHRTDRRSGLPIEPAVLFYPKLVAENMRKYLLFGRDWLRMYRIFRRVKKDPNRAAYTDIAMTPVRDDEHDDMEIYTHSQAARSAVKLERKVKGLVQVENSRIVAEVADPAV